MTDQIERVRITKLADLEYGDVFVGPGRPDGYVVERKVASDWLSETAAAAYLDVTTRTVRRWVADGRLRAYRTPGGRIRFREEDLASSMGPVTPEVSPSPVPAAEESDRSKCSECGLPMPTVRRSDAKFCSPSCRQLAYRIRKAATS